MRASTKSWYSVPPRRWARSGITLLGVVSAGFGLWLLGSAGAIHGKAWLAQVLLEQAWQQTLAGTAVVRPWPWADTYPIARLQVPALGIERIVLAGASGRSLAFGPGHLDGTAVPGGYGHMVLSAHRDTHFRFLGELPPDTAVRLQTGTGAWIEYRVQGGRVIDERDAWFVATPGSRNLTLVTCFPFDALLPGGPLRYLVHAEAIENVGDSGELLRDPGLGLARAEAGRQHQARDDQDETAQMVEM